VSLLPHFAILRKHIFPNCKVTIPRNRAHRSPEPVERLIEIRKKIERCFGERLDFFHAFFTQRFLSSLYQFALSWS